jgi:ankyrin repeat protein
MKNIYKKKKTKRLVSKYDPTSLPFTPLLPLSPFRSHKKSLIFSSKRSVYRINNRLFLSLHAKKRICPLKTFVMTIDPVQQQQQQQQQQHNYLTHDDVDDENDEFFEDWSHLHLLIICENVVEFERSLLSFLSKHNRDVINYLDPQYGTLLMTSCGFHRNISIVRLLLCHGANVNIIEPRFGYSALHMAVSLKYGDNSDDDLDDNNRNQHENHNEEDDPSVNDFMHNSKTLIERTMELIPLLLQHGANTAIKSQCESQMTPLHLCSLNPICISMMELLLESESTTVLSSSNDTDTDNDNDHSNHLINIKDKKGRTSLHSAIYARNIPAVKLLLSYPSMDLQQKDCTNLCPLQYAISLSSSKDAVDDDIDERTRNNADRIVDMIRMEHEKRRRHQIYHDLIHSPLEMMIDQQQPQQNQQEAHHPILHDSHDNGIDNNNVDTNDDFDNVNNDDRKSYWCSVCCYWW